MPFEKLSSLVKINLPNHIKIVDKPIMKLMRDSSMMIYSGSTVAFQALALGLPSIHVITQLDLDLDPLDGARDSRLEAMGLEELRDKILWLLDNREEYIDQHEKGWKSLADSAFGPVTQETYDAFVN